MNRNRELAEFEFDPSTGEARIADASECGADLLVSRGLASKSAASNLTEFVNSRAISTRRLDWGDIVASFGALSPAHLVLMGHGLSLVDQYWYRAPGSTERWEDINFLDNEWDVGFGEALLSRDYSRLATCSPDVPDATTVGHVIKAWERHDDDIILVKHALQPDGADLIGAKLSSDLCAVLFDQGCHVPFDVVERYGRPCAASPLMLASGEEFADGFQLCTMAAVPEDRIVARSGALTQEGCQGLIDAYAAIGLSDASAHVARMGCLSCLAMLTNFHFDNFGAIRTAGSNAWRAAPFFDYDGSFGFYKIARRYPSLHTRPFIAKLL